MRREPARSFGRQLIGGLLAGAFLVLASFVQAAPPIIDLSVKELVSDFSWGYQNGLKQPQGSYLNGKSVHAISRKTRYGNIPRQPPLGSPDFLLWVDEQTGQTLALEHPLGNYEDAVNPGGNAVFGSGAPNDEIDRIWWVTGARANELAFDLSRSSALFDPL